MKRAGTFLMAVLLSAGCSDYSGPSGLDGVYALARVGPNHLPVPLHPGTPIPLLLADTFRLYANRSHIEDGILRQTTVLQDGPGGTIGRSDVEFDYRIEAGALLYDNCPRGSLCAAGLVYAPRVFQMVGDSLFEVTPLGSNLPPYVYGRVR